MIRTSEIQFIHSKQKILSNIRAAVQSESCDKTNAFSMIEHLHYIVDSISVLLQQLVLQAD